MPPGDVLLACAAVTRNTSGDVLAFPLTATAQQTAALLSGIGPESDLESPRPLLSSVSHSFPADALCGPWVTCYQFHHDGTQCHHADIAHTTAETDRHIRATNNPPASRRFQRRSQGLCELWGARLRLDGRKLSLGSHAPPVVARRHRGDLPADHIGWLRHDTQIGQEGRSETNLTTSCRRISASGRRDGC